MAPIQSFKQVTVDGPASRAASTEINHVFVNGVDNYTGPGANNNSVPTGAKISSVTILLAFNSLAAITSLCHLQIECLRSGMIGPVPGVVGGNSQRNTVIHTRMFFINQNQNLNFMFTVRIPKIYQRIRETDQWHISYFTDQVIQSATQVIYKFYR